MDESARKRVCISADEHLHQQHIHNNFHGALYLLVKEGAASRYQQSPFLFVLLVCDVY